MATSRNVDCFLRLEDLETKRFTLLANGTAIVCVFAPLDHVVSHAAVINGRHAMLLLEEERSGENADCRLQTVDRRLQTAEHFLR